MPDLREMLRKAREEEVQRTKRKITKGVRPDRILRGEIQFGDNGRVITQPGSLHPSSSSVESSIESSPPTKKSEQSQSKPVSQPRTKSEQSQSEVGTNSEQQVATGIESQNKVSTQPRTQPRTKSEQSQNEPRTQANFLSIVGLQRRIVLFVYDLCRAKGERTTGSVSLEQLANACRTTPGAAQVTNRRLMQKHLLRRVNYKDGRGGWTDYELPEEVYGALYQLESQNKLRTNTEQSQSKVSTQPSTQPRTSPSSSSSKDLDLNKLTNTGDPEVFADLPSEWNEIDSSPLTAIRFGRSQLQQLTRVGTLTVEQVQESINAFAFDLEVNEKGREINGHALNYFMGILRKGPYAPSANYESPEVRQMRLYLEGKEREQKIRVDLESRLESVAFDEWTTGLTVEDRTRLVPVTDFAKPGSQGHNVQLKQHFRENVWPERRRDYLKGVKPDDDASSKTMR